MFTLFIFWMYLSDKGCLIKKFIYNVSRSISAPIIYYYEF